MSHERCLGEGVPEPRRGPSDLVPPHILCCISLAPPEGGSESEACSGAGTSLGWVAKWGVGEGSVLKRHASSAEGLSSEDFLGQGYSLGLCSEQASVPSSFFQARGSSMGWAGGKWWPQEGLP